MKQTWENYHKNYYFRYKEQRDKTTNIWRDNNRQYYKDYQKNYYNMNKEKRKRIYYKNKYIKPTIIYGKYKIILQ
jgi:hypothetical protein